MTPAHDGLACQAGEKGARAKIVITFDTEGCCEMANEMVQQLQSIKQEFITGYSRKHVCNS